MPPFHFPLLEETLVSSPLTVSKPPQRHSKDANLVCNPQSKKTKCAVKILFLAALPLVLHIMHNCFSLAETGGIGTVEYTTVSPQLRLE